MWSSKADRKRETNYFGGGEYGVYMGRTASDIVKGIGMHRC